MATITINRVVIESNGWSIGEFLLMVATMNHINLDDAKQSLLSKGLVTDHCEPSEYPPMGIAPMQAGVDAYNTIVIESDPSNIGMSDAELTELAKKLKEIYPKGKKDDRFYWADGVALIVRRLKAFFKKYGNHSADNIIDATQRYVDSKEGQPDMRLLKYFIFKEGRNAGTGEVESSSDLLTYIENKDEEETELNWMLNER